MSQRGKFKRYLLILERLATVPSLEQLRAHLHDYGHEVSARTLQRDMEDLRDEFDIEVQYSRQENGYRIVEGLDAVSMLIRLLERVQLLELVRDGGKSKLASHGYLQFEELGRLQGIQHMETLLLAVRERREVKVDYRKFGAEEAKLIQMRPHLLKEFRGRWYVLGPANGYDHPIALGLDRIEGIQVLSNRFKRSGQKLNELYDSAIGVDTSPGRPELIELHFSPHQVPYVKALPLHHTQTLVSEDEHGAVFRLYVMPNFELRQLLLGMGDAVKVLDPDHLAQAIHQAHRAAASRYAE